MHIGVIKESRKGENRVAVSPEVTGQLVKNGHQVSIESGAGLQAGFTDEQYTTAGGTISSNSSQILAQSDVVAKVNAPNADEISNMKEGSVLISFLYAHTVPDTLDALNKRKISAFAMDAVPRISRAQNMDALSSQANLAGYKAVILGATAMGSIFPLLMTAAGTIKPSRVLIYGTGVAGLQAIATAKRLGAIVEVTDVRPETKEQVESLGGKFISVESTDKVEIQGGYAKEVSADYLAKQKEAVNKSLFQADLVITTALVMGKKAPVLITEDQVKMMKQGAVIVDMAVEQGGNCALSQLDQTIEVHGVKLVGQSNLSSTVSRNASELYAKNILNLLNHLATKDGFKWEMEEEITKGSLKTHHGSSHNS